LATSILGYRPGVKRSPALMTSEKRNWTIVSASVIAAGTWNISIPSPLTCWLILYAGM
jgi:hypothetical protein